MDGIIKLIVKENMEKPIIVGHFVQGAQLAMRLAIDYPEKIGGAIILGGPAKYISVMGGLTRDFPLDTLKMFTDNFTAPRWFKHMKKSFFDKNNFLPEVYSLDSSKGKILWQQSTDVPMSVKVRYVCEYFASDIKVEVFKIKCPVLVLRSTFSAQILQNPINNYIQPQFMDSWNDATSKNKLIAIKDIQNASTFVWKDQPEQTYETIHIFIGSIK